MIVVTGASGLVGGNLVRALLSQGRPVRALVHHDRRALDGLDVETASADLNDLASLEQAFRGAQVVYHPSQRHLDPHGQLGRAGARQCQWHAQRGGGLPALRCAAAGVLQFHPRLPAGTFRWTFG